MKIHRLLLSYLLLSACTTTPPIEHQADGSYRIDKKAESSKVSVDDLKAEAFKNAHDLATKEGKEVVVVKDGAIPDQKPHYNLIFRLRDPWAEEVMKSCLENMERDPVLALISKKVSLGGASDQPPSMLNNPKFPTKAEKKAIARFIELRRDCVMKADRHFERSGYPKTIIALNDLTAGSIDSLLMSLQKADLNYGRFAKLRKKITDIRAAALVNIDQALRANNSESEYRAESLVEKARSEMSASLPTKE